MEESIDPKVLNAAAVAHDLIGHLFSNAPERTRKSVITVQTAGNALDSLTLHRRLTIK